MKWSRYRSGVAQRVGRGITLLFHDRGTRRGWVVSSTPRPHVTPGKDLVPILHEAGWVPGPVWTGAENLVPTGIRSRTVQPVVQALYRLSYPAHSFHSTIIYSGKKLNLVKLKKMLKLFPPTLRNQALRVVVVVCSLLSAGLGGSEPFIWCTFYFTPWAENSCTFWVGWTGLRASVDVFDPAWNRTPDRPALSQSIYLLRYSEFITPKLCCEIQQVIISSLSSPCHFFLTSIFCHLIRAFLFLICGTA